MHGPTPRPTRPGGAPLSIPAPRRRPGRIRAAGVAAALTAGSVVAIAATPAHAGPTLLRAITQNVLSGLSHASDHGAAPAGSVLNLTITLRRPDPAGEQALISAENNPSSSQYRHFLTPAQFAARFAVPAAQQSAVRSFLAGGGLDVDSTSVAGDVWSVHGTVAAISALFQTPIHSFTAGSSAFLANTRLPSFPFGLPIANIAGLNTLQHYTPTHGSTTAQGTCLGTTCIGATTPQDLWTAYDQPGSYTGQGQGLAVFGEGQSDGVVSDLRAFEAQFGLPQVPVTVKHPAGDTNFSDDSGHEEWNIDTQGSSGMAPDASSLTLYFGSDLSDADVNRLFSTFADDANGPLQASASFGECETVPVVSALVGQALSSSVIASLPVGIGLGNNSDAALDAVTRQAAAEGKTVFVSTGDTGSSCPVVYAAVIGAGNGVLNQGAPITNSPASLPYVTAVGGTVLYTDPNGLRAREYGWAFSGGGSTLFTPAPDYQQGTAGNVLPCVTAPTTTCRGIADVAAQSGDVLTNGYTIISAGQPSQGGGTSLSAPLMQGMWARVQSAAGPGGNGFANYPIYRVGKDATQYARGFFDVNSADPTTGLPASNGAYVTTPGWDYVTGWGVPKVAGLICDLTGKVC